MTRGQWQRRWYGLMGLLLAAVVFLGISLWQEEYSGLRIIFFDVGQGDAILISEGGNQVLIDGGRSGQVLVEHLGRYLPFWDRRIEAVVATHPDEDHIGGLIGLLDAYRVGAFLETNVRSESKTYRILQQRLAERQVRKVETFEGLTVRFSDALLEALLPRVSFDPVSVKDTNATSIVLKLLVYETVFLFTGDLPSEREGEIRTDRVNVLKVGHHGSKSSTGEEFLERLRPEQAVLSVGKENRYGHPAPEVLGRLRQARVKILRTDESGDIVYTCTAKTRSCAVSVERR
jgi:competence protein ComEC